jgi:hypothetical protein
VIAHLSTLAQLEKAVTAQSTTHPDGSYVVSEAIDIGGVSLKPAEQDLLPAMKRVNMGYFTLVT